MQTVRHIIEATSDHERLVSELIAHLKGMMERK